MFYRSLSVGARSFTTGVAVAIALALAGVGAASSAAANLPAGFQDEVVFSGLKEPTNFKFAPDGRVFVALKNGKILVYENLSDTTPEVVDDLSEQVYDYSDHGLLGLAIDPAFALNHRIYALFSYDHVLGKTPADGEEGRFPRWGTGPTFEGDGCPESTAAGCPTSGRLIRLTVEGNHVVPGSEKVLLEDWCDQYTSHSIGDLGFGPEGALYVSGGDGASFNASDYGQFGNRCGDPPGRPGENLAPPAAEGGSLRAQSALRPNGPASLDGALLRINPETGEGWPGNPFAASADANRRRIVAFGFRNPFRFTVDSRTNSVYVGNVGLATDEEIDQVPMNAPTAYNSGWPCVEALAPNPGFKNVGLTACNRLYSTPGSTSPPLFYYDHSSPVVPGDPCSSKSGSAISAGAFYEGSQWPAAYHDAYVFADPVRDCLYVMRAGADGDPEPLTAAPFVSETTPYSGVDIEAGPEGNIFYSSLFGPLGGTIHRVSYDPGAPQARLSSNRQWGTTLPLSVTFDASASTGAEGHSLLYEWDLDGDGNYEAATSVPTKTVTYAEAKNVNASVRVKDASSPSHTAIARMTIYPGDSPPKVAISEPSSSLTWGVGQQLKFAGTAKAEEGLGAALPASGFYWRTRLLHCPFSATDCHEHPLQVFPATKSGELPAPDHDFPSYVSFELTASDSRGLSATATVKIAARPVSLQMISIPPGIELTAGPKTAAGPFELQAIEGSPTTLAAPATATIGGVTYEFQGWSDGGTRTHTVDADASASYTATYTGSPPVTPPTSAGIAGASPPASGPSPRALRLRSEPAKRTRGRRARFVFEGSATGYRCRLDGGPYVACSSPRVYRHLAPGSHVFRLLAVGSDGEPAAAVVKYSWRVIAPEG